MENHVPFKHRRMTLERAEKFISTHHFTDINLRSRLYPARAAVSSLTHYAAPGRITYQEAVKGKYTPVKVGQSFGPTWATHWFRVEVGVSADWVGQEVRLVWNSNSEAMVWIDGEPRQGLSKLKDRFDFILSYKQDQSKLKYVVYVEMACNNLLGVGKNSLIGPADPDRHFALEKVEVATFDREVYALVLDLEILHGMAKELPDTERGNRALYAANDIVNACDVTDRSTYKMAAEISKKFFSQRNGEGQHTVHVMGHSHIDTAWLWAYDETKRKCGRSWACTLRLMEQYPHFKFACSQAQQFEWVKEHYPTIYKDICKFVANGQFIPVGGTWVEMDGYVPSGEAFVRQFLYGQRYFQKEFGVKCAEFWLPDTFGYAAQLPQIMRECGITRFVTQKMSWNLVNKFPHHTFWWEGLDGSRVLSHFPPGDSYHLEGRVNEVLYTEKNFRDKGRSNSTMYLFGYGDGGNGPDEHMLQRLKRMEDVNGLPLVKMSSPGEFFEAIEKEEKEDGRLCTWRGELYLEMHNGTYTTHAKVKERNRRGEFLLQDIELVWSLAVAVGGGKGSGEGGYPSAEIEHLWKLVLLNQFHDVLPGSSITIVYEDAHKLYDEIESKGQQLLEKGIALLGSSMEGKSQKGKSVLLNPLAWSRSSIVPLPPSADAKPPKRGKRQTQADSLGNTLVSVEVPSCSLVELDSCIKTVEDAELVTAEKQGELFVLRNSLVEAKVDGSGRLTSLRCAGSSRELLQPGCPGNQLLLYDDVPLYWDAWDIMDYHLETRKPLTQVTQNAIVKDKGPLRASLEVTTKISDVSTITQSIQLDAGSPYVVFNTQVEWHENRKCLKVEFPTSVHSMEVTYEVQYGALRRPNHFNTSWDSARYEVCGQKWADISEHGAGLSVMTDSKYGYSSVGGVLRVSLLRSPKAPDAEADMGTHNFSYAVMPHKGSWQQAGTVQAAFQLNRPLKVTQLELDLPLPSSPAQSFFWLDSPQVVLDTVKMAEDQPGRVMVVRLYEAFGGQAEVTLNSSLAVRSACRCNCLEEVVAGGELSINSDKGVASIPLQLQSFQILTVLLTL